MQVEIAPRMFIDWFARVRSIIAYFVGIHTRKTARVFTLLGLEGDNER
jgi:hypothetical protein